MLFANMIYFDNFKFSDVGTVRKHGSMNVKQFWKAVLAQDEKEIRKYFHKDAYVNWHCTNEHFTIDEYIIANCEYPGEWDGIDRALLLGGVYFE